MTHPNNVVHLHGEPLCDWVQRTAEAIGNLGARSIAIAYVEPDGTSAVAYGFDHRGSRHELVSAATNLVHHLIGKP